MSSVRAGLSCEVLTDLSSLVQMEAEWDALYQAMAGPYLSYSHQWARLSWEFVCRPRGRKLFCIVVRQLDAAVAIFPLVLSRRQFWRIASPLSPEASEYCPFLIHPQANPSEVMSAILRKLEDVRGVHGLYLPFVRADGPLGRWLATRAGAVCTLTLPAAGIRFDGCADWESYLATRSGHMRAELRRKLRRAEGLGELRFCEITDPQERQAVWRWLVGCKKALLARRGVNDWLLSPHHVKFTAATLDAFDRRRPLLAIKLDDAVIAAGLCSAGPTWLEGFVMAYDQRHGGISPGALLQLHCARWAFECGLQFDMRTGHEAYKARWANDVGHASIYAVALTRWGRLYVASERARRWIGLRVLEPFRAEVRRRLRALPHHDGVRTDGAADSVGGAS